MDERAQLLRARAAAQECERSATQFTDFAQRLSAVVGPAEMAEYDELVAREEAALAERIAAFNALGLATPSVQDNT